jgi:hypothetical protein
LVTVVFLSVDGSPLAVIAADDTGLVRDVMEAHGAVLHRGNHLCHMAAVLPVGPAFARAQVLRPQHDRVLHVRPAGARH